jgi:hypothetical protein
MEYTKEQEIQLRIAELEAILTNEKPDSDMQRLSLEVELQFLKKYTDGYDNLQAFVELPSGETAEIILDNDNECFSMTIYSAKGNPMLPHYFADTLDELLKEVCEY